STDAGESWTQFRAGVPTVSVMDMAIQQRENDLVLGTHGRGIFVIDDYSGLRGLNANGLRQRLDILSATDGLQYLPAQTPSTRFPGSGEFRADNEPYGAIITFVASGDDLAHPDEDKERQRKMAQRNAGADKDGDKPNRDKPLKVKIEVSNEDGKVIRTFTAEVHQGINRVAWNLRHDGVRPMPGGDAPDPDADLPSGPRVPGGEYTIALSLGSGDDEARDSIAVSVVTDPRLGVSEAARRANYTTLLELNEMEEQLVSATEQVVRAREDLDTVKSLISRRQKQDDSGEAENMKALKERIDAARKSLDEVEKAFRTPPDTKGIVFDDHRVANKLGSAQYYVASTLDAPSPATQVYIEEAGRALAAALEKLDAVMSGEVEPLRADIEAAGIRLLSTSR
ncbi:MAG: hypothetical protein R3212_04610, partial [Xanthomonadales bacterium]|nr:hypothetical protein [Xanthomonadales bacterium]